ncbi:MAG: XRE family transcriptional regulator [Pseudomonadota bacterium]
MFNGQRLTVARQRRGLTGRALSQEADISPITVSRLERGENKPDEDTIQKLSRALRYPVSFFFGDDLDVIETEAVSFRSLSKMRAVERDSALSAGSIALQVSDWLEERFSLPNPNFIDLSYEDNIEAAARTLRDYWSIGVRSIASMIGLLEKHGARVFSLSEATASVDAFSFWRDGVPFVFLNTFKTAERGVFDAAHELGHLVLHRHGGTHLSRQAEREADAFASAFLMPAEDVRSRMPRRISTDTILKAKKRWRVSAMAMAYRLHKLELLTDWQYKSTCIELSRRGYRTDEPDGIEREHSRVWKTVFTQLWSEKTTKQDMAKELALPIDELESIFFGLIGASDRTSQAEAVKLSSVT